MSESPTISRATLRIARPTSEARRATAPYLIHQAVADLFGDRGDRGYVYRELGTDDDVVTVLILSTDPPLPISELSSPSHRRVLSVESKPFVPELTPGQVVDYEIRVNATKIVWDRETNTKQRKDVWDAVWRADPSTPSSPHDLYGAWLSSKLTAVAEVLAARVTERGEVRARRGAGDTCARFIAANIIGSLRVVEPNGLLSSMVDGLGRARAFGCGLMCLSRPGSILPRRHPGEAEAILR
jgi:CRISPR system Cascade subunit CasE